MTFKTPDLRAFLQAAGRIKTSTIMPVLSFIRFQNGTITKNNLREFVQYTCDFAGEFMVEERILRTFVDATRAEEVTITYTDKKVTMTDGTTKVSSPNESLANFPANEQPEGQAFTLSPDACMAIGIASQMLTDDDNQHPRVRHVFVGGKIIAGVDGWTGYVQKFEDDLPQIMLAKGAAQTISRIDGAGYTNNASYDFFTTGSFLYGFIKPECLWMDMGSILLRKADCPSFVIDKGELTRFCENCLAASPLDGITAEMNNYQKLSLKMHDSGFNVEVNKEITVDGDSCTAFKFQPKLMLRLLKALPAQEVKAWRGNRCYYFTSENFTASLQEII